jgi:hypothetical protein
MKMVITRREFLEGMAVLSGGMLMGQTWEGSALGGRKARATTPLLLAHYMPWYQTPDESGYWGWHWTMDHFDPNQTDENGRRQIASHYMPLTGPYDSNDDALLEYQVLLMRLSGIDGIIVDWYGMEGFRDYGVLDRATRRLFQAAQKAGLTFSICYEDQSIMHMVNDNRIPKEEALPHGQEVMLYMEENWFNDPAYLKYGDQPVLFTFGPQYFKSANDWEELFSVLQTPAALVTLDKHRVANQLASYPWPPMQGMDLNSAVIEAYLEQFYRAARRDDYIVGGAFPGFNDIYEEAGVRSSYGFLDAEAGELFRMTLRMALEQNPNVIQLVTWNDYGEGTIIEPTEEFGYRYLEILQETRKGLSPEFAFTAEDLQLPLGLFELRQAGEVEAARLDEAAAAIIAGDVTGARAVIEG